MSRNTTLLAVILIAIGSTQTLASTLPSVTGTLAYNLDAAVNVTTSGGSVSAWQDAGGGTTFSQATAGNQPTSFTSGFGVNNLPYVSFDGATTKATSDFLNTVVGTNPRTVFIVGKTTVSNPLGGLFGAGALSIPSDNGLRLDGTSGSGVFDNSGGYPSTSLAWTNSSGVTTNGTGGSLTISPGVGPLYIIAGTDSNASEFNVGTSIGNYFYSNDPVVTNSFYWNRAWGGHIAEIVVYSTVLNSTDQATITNFLYNKYFAVPEPGCFSLLGFGIAGLFTFGRRLRRA